MSSDAYDKIEEAATSLGRRAQWEAANRVGLLVVHAFMGMHAGTLILLFGTAANIEDAAGLWSRTALGLLGVIGGIVLSLGLVRRPRSITFEALGLALIGAWDLAMTAGMLAARIKAGEFSPRALTEPLPAPGTYVLPYPIAVYAGLFALICVHLWTLRKMRRDVR